MEMRIQNLSERNRQLVEKILRKQRRQERHRERWKQEQTTQGSEDLVARLEKMCLERDKEIESVYRLLARAVDLQKDFVGVLKEILHSHWSGPTRGRTLTSSSDSSESSDTHNEEFLLAALKKKRSKTREKVVTDRAKGIKLDELLNTRSGEDIQVVKPKTIVQHMQDNISSRNQKTIDSGLLPNTPESSDGLQASGVTQTKRINSKTSVVKTEQSVDKCRNKNTMNSENVELGTQAAAGSSERTEQPKIIKQTEVRRVTVNFWRRKAEEEVNIGVALKASAERSVGLNTVLCLDISESMAGKAWEQMMKFVNKYLTDIELEASTFNRHENVALVTFGHDTRVIHHFTTDYPSVRKSVENLYPGGPTTIYGGLVLSYGAILGSGVDITFSGIVVHPRILLVTDGKPSECDLMAGPDTSDCLQDEEERFNILHAVCEIANNKNKIYAVPVGDFEVDLLTRISFLSYGELLLEDKHRDAVSKLFRNALVAGNYLKTPRLLMGLDRLFLRGHLMANPDLTEEDMIEIEKLLVEYQTLEADIADNQNINIEGMPPVGSRVRRGPEWKTYVNDDENGPGTIVGQRPNGFVRVHWDAGITGVYCYGDKGQFEVVIVDEPVIPTNEHDAPVGCCVQIGQDWTPTKMAEVGSDDVGVVVRHYRFAIVMVYWPNGLRVRYAMGYRGLFQLKAVAPTPLRSSRPALKALPSPDSTADEAAAPGEPPRNKNKPAVTESPLIISSTPGQDVAGPSTSQVSVLVRNRANQEAGLITQQGAAASPVIFQHAPPPGASRAPPPGTSTGDIASSGSQKQGAPRKNKNLGNQIPPRSEHSDTSFSSQGTVLTGNSAVEGVNKRKWYYQSPGGLWVEYPEHVAEKIENAYMRNPNSTVIIQLEDEPVRVVFQRMQQTGLHSKTVMPVKMSTED